MQTTDDIGATVLKVQNGTPSGQRCCHRDPRPQDTAGTARESDAKPDGTVIDDDDVVEGIVLMRKGAEAEGVLQRCTRKSIS